MKILVTGATGFLGSAFRDLALVRGHSVAGLIRPETATRRPQPVRAGMTWLEGTLQAPPWQAIQTFAPEACVHTAWITTPGVFLQASDNELYFRWSLPLIAGLARLGVEYCAVLGTCIEYQLGPKRLSEDCTPLAPTTPYAEWKHRLHSALEKELAGTGMALGWTRVFYPYGVGEDSTRLCTSIIRSMRRGEPTLLKTPNSTKDYIYVEDLARAVLTVVESRFEGSVNVGTGQAVTIRHLAHTVAEVVGRPDLLQEATGTQDDPFACVIADSSRIRSLGWEPAVTLRAGVRKLVDHLSSLAPSDGGRAGVRESFR